MGCKPPRYRPLRPTAPNGGQPSASVTEWLPRRNATTKIACKECREKKRKCDGQEPSCTACQRNGQQCKYRKTPPTASTEALTVELETLRGRYQVLESFVTKLRLAPHARAQDALRELRSSPSKWPADLDAQAQQPKASSPTSTANGLKSPLSEPDNAACIPPLDTCDPAPDLGSSSAEQCQAALAETDPGDCYDQPLRTPDLGLASPSGSSLSFTKKAPDPRLKGLDIAFWTAVPVTDVFATDALSSYLKCDHRIWELFDADSFLSDLVAQKSDFCSAFLVNCLMAFASQAYGTTTDCPSATSKGLEFEGAAGILWGLEATRLDSEMALTGLILLYLCFAARQEAGNADDCLRQVFEMAIRMKLFGVEERISDYDMSFLKADRKSSMNHAAWGAFNTVRLIKVVDWLKPLKLNDKFSTALSLVFLSSPPPGVDRRLLDSLEADSSGEYLGPSKLTGQNFGAAKVHGDFSPAMQKSQYRAN